MPITVASVAAKRVSRGAKSAPPCMAYPLSSGVLPHHVPVLLVCAIDAEMPDARLLRRCQRRIALIAKPIVLGR